MLAVTAGVAVLVVVAATCTFRGRATHDDPSVSPAALLASATSATAAAAVTTTTTATVTATVTAPPSLPRPSPTTPPRTHPAIRPGITAGGMWWGVDSSGPITSAALDNVRGWYQGATPQFWGRYVSGSYAVGAAELAFARAHGIYVYLLVNDRNCSVCAGGSDVCGNDRTPEQARSDALDAIAATRGVGVKRGAVLFKDIEQIGACAGEPTATYVDTWYRTLQSTDYRTGFYGNTHRQDYDFPKAYCAVVAHDRTFATKVVLDMNEDEPQLGAVKGSVGPRSAPAFNPLVPSCSPRGVAKIWQYGESTDPANYTDIDQAVPGTAGLLAPDGSITGECAPCLSGSPGRPESSVARRGTRP